MYGQPSTTTIPWTAERVERLRVMVERGDSAGVICKALGGVSRNAVIGVVFRRGWKLGARGPCAPREGRERLSSANHRPKAAPRPSAPAPIRNATPRPPKPEGAIAAPPDRRPLRIVPPVCEPVGLLDLTAGQCHYPVNDGEDPTRGFLFCAGPREDGGPYCAGHAALCSSGLPEKRKHRARAA